LKTFVILILAGLTALGAAKAPPPRWWAPGDGRVFPERIDYPNADGSLGVQLTGGAMATKGHPFFTAMGPDGRACVTCHQPADSMSLSAATARERWDSTGGRDPLFAAYDGSNCPALPQKPRASHSLLLDYGLIRVERPWPVKGADFSIEVVRDPTGCNSASHGPGAGKISVYRRPRPIGNMKYLLAMGFAYDPKAGMPLPLDPESGQPVSGNFLADGRALTLKAQMADAAATHLRMAKDLSAEQIKAITDFEMRVYTAQQRSRFGPVDADGAEGGTAMLVNSPAGRLNGAAYPVWAEYRAWEKDNPALSPAERAFRLSVARGAKSFRERTFLISDSAGINSPVGFGNPVRNACAFCHNMTQMGNDVAPGQVDLGTTNQPFADPAPHLPLFRVTCLGPPHRHYGRTILTSDPGYALTTGKCADVGKITLQSNRGLAARAPYFSNGSARDLRAIIDYYDRRYAIHYSEQEKQDLVNLLSVL
jgi:cytochrome c peroxidase